MAQTYVIPRRPRTFGWDETGVLLGALTSSLALTWLVWDLILLMEGTPGFLAVWVTVFLIVYHRAVKELEGRLAAKDKVATIIVGMLALAFLIPLTLILVFVFLQGIKALTLGFFVRTMETTGPQDPATEGGGLHALVGTLQQLALAVVLAVPLGILTAVYLQEIGGRLAKPIRMFVLTMSGVPSIVAGLFIYSFWILRMGFGFSGFAASMALAILMLPTITRTAEEVLRLVPGGLRESSLALGASEFKSTWKVVLPTARAGIATAVILGMARVIGETAPLFMTSFGNSGGVNANPFEGAQESLPYFVWRNYKLQLPASIDRAYTGALVLLMFVLILFIVTRILGKGRVARKAEHKSKARPVAVEGP